MQLFRRKCLNFVLQHEKMNDLIKLVQSLQESGLLTKGVKKTIKKETK